MRIVSAEQRIAVGRILTPMSHPQDFPVYTPCIIPETLKMMGFTPVTGYFLYDSCFKDDYPGSPDLNTGVL